MKTSTHRVFNIFSPNNQAWVTFTTLLWSICLQNKFKAQLTYALLHLQKSVNRCQTANNILINTRCCISSHLSTHFLPKPCCSCIFSIHWSSLCHFFPLFLHLHPPPFFFVLLPPPQVACHIKDLTITLRVSLWCTRQLCFSSLSLLSVSQWCGNGTNF